MNRDSLRTSRESEAEANLSKTDFLAAVILEVFCEAEATPLPPPLGRVILE